jgi:hypothetical protein
MTPSIFIVLVLLFFYLAAEIGIRVLFWFQSGREIEVYKIMCAIYFGRSY